MRLLVTGAAGQLGSEIVWQIGQLSAERTRDKIDLLAADRSILDVSSREGVLSVICQFEPDVVFHSAAFTDVDGCELDPDKAWSVNALGTRHVAEAARLVGAHLVYVSTDYVFDGASSRPYVEWDAPGPLSVYGASKLGGERELDSSSTIVRTSWLVGRNGANIAKTVLRLAREQADELRFVDDQHGSPTIAEDLARKVVELGLGRRPGCFHVTNQGETTWYGFARQVLATAGLEESRVVPISTDELAPARPAPRPSYSVLDNAVLRLAGEELLEDWQESLGRLVRQLG